MTIPNVKHIINKHKKIPFVRTYTNGNMSVFKY